METSTLKQKIHSLIDTSNEDVLQSVYQLLQDEEYTDEFKSILKEDYKLKEQLQSEIKSMLKETNGLKEQMQSELKNILNGNTDNYLKNNNSNSNNTTGHY